MSKRLRGRNRNHGDMWRGRGAWVIGAVAAVGQVQRSKIVRRIGIN